MTSTAAGRATTPAPAAGPRHRRHGRSRRGTTPLPQVGTAPQVGKTQAGTTPQVGTAPQVGKTQAGTAPQVASAHQSPPAAPDAVEAELAEPIRVISARLWAIVAALVIALSTAAAWAFTGSWPQSLSTTAIVMHGDGPQVARAAAAGSVAEVTVTVGQPVTAGQQVAAVQQPDGTRAPVVAPAAGTVVALLSNPGTAVLPGAPVVAVDADSLPMTAQLVVSDPTELHELAAGRPVLLQVDDTALTGRIGTAPPTRTTTTAVATQLVVGATGLPAGDAPVWLVPVDLDGGQQITGPGVAAAVVALPSIPVYQLVTGSGR